MALFEIRQYTIASGRMSDWIAFMDSHIVPFITSQGMVVNAMFSGAEDPHSFIWIRQFDDEAHRESLYQAVYETEYWQNEVKPTVRELVEIEKVVVHRMHPTPSSPLQ